jgi:pyridoxal phosphate enzyme (YggS family)
MLIPSQSWGEDIVIDSSLVKRNLDEIKQNIAHYNVKIIAVTKYFGQKAMIAGYKAGIRDFAESRAIEAIEKINSLPDEVRKNSTFHFIGHLQSNKAGRVVQNFDVIHSVDSLKIAKAISKAACTLNKREKILLQVNNAGEEQKSGFSKNDLRNAFEEIFNLEGVEVLGLMNMAPLGASESELEKLFGDIREFRDELEKGFGVKLPELSMGMSDDYKTAVREGATIIRIGRKLFT